VAGQVIAPAVGLVAVHVAQEVHPLVAAQHGFHFVCQLQGLLQVPLRQHAGVHDQVALFVDGEGAMAQPVDELVAISGVEDVVQGIVAVRWTDAAGHGQQVQVVVAQHCLCALAHLHDGAQRLQGLRATVDEVAGEDELRFLRQRQLALEIQERSKATLQVADDVMMSLLHEAGQFWNGSAALGRGRGYSNVKMWPVQCARLLSK